MTKPNKELLETYRQMAKDSAVPDMKQQIRENLLKTCDKFAGHEDRLDDCIEYLTDCARGILDSKSGDVPDEVCYRICRDYFNDEIWKKEDEEKAAKETKRKESAEKNKAPKKAAKKTEPKVKKAACDIEKEQLDKERERIEKLKEKHGLKTAEPVKEEPVKAETVKAEPVKAEPAIEALVKKDGSMKPEPGQLDFFAAMGV